MDAQAILEGRSDFHRERPASLYGKPSFGPNDLFIAVMGVTGSGKSTFISQCTSAEVQVGHGLKSHTSDIKIFPLQYNDQTVHLIDTPGFDDTYRSDIDVLKDVSFWLNKSYKEQDIKLTGIVYLHRITDNKVGGTARKDLQMFKKLCGEDSFSSVVLATTMWAYVTIEDGNRREKELRTSTEFYGSMVGKGAMMFRHTNDNHSAMNIVAYLVNRRTTTVLNIQREMANEGRTLIETEAGRELDSEILRQTEHIEKKLKENQARMDAALKEKDAKLAQELAEQQSQLNAKIEAAQQGRDELKVSMEKLFKDKDEQFQKAMLELDTERKEREKIMDEKTKDLESFKKTIKEAEEISERKRMAQEAEIEEYRAQLSQANAETLLVLQAAMVAMKEQEEERIAKEEQNLAAAREEACQQEMEIMRKQLQAQAQLAEQSHFPQYYNTPPPPYQPPYPYNQGYNQGYNPGYGQAYNQGYYPADNPQNIGQGAAIMGSMAGLGMGAAAMGCSVM